MSRGDRKCLICQKAYRFCGHCANEEHREDTWRTIFCSENCREIFNILSMQGNGHIESSEAKSKLAKLDLSKLEGFRDDFKKQIESINKSYVAVEQPKNIEKKDDAPKFQKPLQQQNKKIVKEDSKN